MDSALGSVSLENTGCEILQKLVNGQGLLGHVILFLTTKCFHNSKQAVYLCFNAFLFDSNRSLFKISKRFRFDWILDFSFEFVAISDETVKSFCHISG